MGAFLAKKEEKSTYESVEKIELNIEPYFRNNQATLQEISPLLGILFIFLIIMFIIKKIVERRIVELKMEKESLLQHYNHNEKSSYEKLEDIELNIRNIETYFRNNQALQKRYTRRLLISSLVLCVLYIAIIACYFVNYPTTLQKMSPFFGALFVFLIIIFLIKTIVAYYFKRRINQNTHKIVELKMEKEKLLQHVMEHENYNAAIAIINRFGNSPAVPCSNLYIGHV